MQDAPYEHMPHEDPQQERGESGSIWMRGLTSILFMILLNVANSLLGVLTVIQFFWMLITSERNLALKDFGASIGRWMGEVAAFQAAETDERPFPWAPWPAK